MNPTIPPPPPPAQSPVQNPVAPTPKPTVPSQTETPPKSKKPWLKLLLWSTVAIIVIFMSVFIWFVMALSSVRADVPVDGKIIEIKAGTSLENIADDLSSNNLITDKNVFVLWAKFSPARGQLKPGPYLIKPTSSIRQIVADMSAGKIAINKITFPEGITINDMAKRWSAAGYGSKDEYIAATKKLAINYAFIPAVAKDNPEGYLFPATYSFSPGSSAEVVVSKQYEAFKTQAEPLLQGALPDGLTKHQVLTLASIVEREALTATDRKLTAGVFLNRLRLGMKLESDVTVNYATGKTTTSPGDLSVVSPYNTYIVRALPPTPINNPSTDSIEAVMAFTPSDYIFFLAGKDSKVYYAKTLSEHNENIKNHL